MQIRILALQKYHDGIWIASIILACISILIQIGLFFVLYKSITSDIRIARKQPLLVKYNTLALFIVLFLTIINIVINILMFTINPQSFLDSHSLEILQQRTR